jgi:chromosome partitioning protein
MRRIAIAAAKGGTGKTTTAVTLAHALALAGRRVLLVDCDPRRHASLHFGVPPSSGLAGWLAGARAEAFEVRAGLRVLDSGGPALCHFGALSGADAEERLRRRLSTLPETDYLLLDCAPDSGVWQRRTLLAADEVLVPVGSDFLGLAGAEALREMLAAMPRQSARRFLGILPTFYEPGSCSAEQFESQLEARFPESKLDVRVRTCEALRLAAASRGTVYDSEPLARGALDYAELAERLEQAVA